SRSRPTRRGWPRFATGLRASAPARRCSTPSVSAAILRPSTRRCGSAGCAPEARGAEMAKSHTKGLRVVAIFEAAKGLVVLLAGFGLLALVHKDLQVIAEELVSHTHLNPASEFPRIFLDLAARLANVKFWLLAVFAFCYATLRLVEAYG